MVTAMSNPLPEPGTWGVTYGSGLLAWAIHRAERKLVKDQRAAWAGHAVYYIGLRDGIPSIVQAEWPKVIISPASAHPDTVWAAGQQLTQYQRARGVAKALSLVGARYDPVIYAWYVLKVINAGLSRDLATLFADSRWGEIICSGVDVQCLQAQGVSLEGLATAATEDPDFICPADLYAWGIANGWMDWVPRS